MSRGLMILQNLQTKDNEKARNTKGTKKGVSHSFSDNNNKLRTDQTHAKIGTERHQELSNYRTGVKGVPSILKRGYQLEHLPVRGRVRPKI